MRFKDKLHRTVHHDCKQCSYKNGIKCTHPLGYDTDNDYKGQCYNHFPSDSEEYKFKFRYFQNNWKKMHQQQAKEELLNSIKQDMEDTKWFDELWEAIEND